MAKWQAEIKVTNIGSYFPVTVEAGASYVAKETIQHIYNPVSIRNLHQVSNRSSNSSGGSDVSLDGTVGLIGLIAAGWAFFTFTPWVLMGLGGAAGTWIGEKVTGTKVEDYDEDDESSGKKAAITFILAIILGGVGFVQGHQIKQGFDAPSDTPAQIQQK